MVSNSSRGAFFFENGQSIRKLRAFLTALSIIDQVRITSDDPAIRTAMNDQDTMMEMNAKCVRGALMT